jgi:UDP-3-O-[3-hydroxymyristoyl] glucosamine N-acyltransferase
MTVRQIAELVGGAVEGDGSVTVRGLAAVETAGPEQLTFAADAKYAGRLAESKAAAAIVGDAPPAARMTLIRVGDVQRALAALLAALADPEDLPPAGVHPSAVVSADAEVAADAAVGPGVFVGSRARIGPRTALCANAFVGRGAVIGEDVIVWEGAAVKAGCTVGDRVRIGPNSVIGYDGFGYYQEEGVHRRIPHAGTVVIEDDVEIGACSCVDRAKFGCTRIGSGTKIDNLVQVAHNVRIGRGCLLAGQAGVAGSARLGDHVVAGGHSGIRDNVVVGDGVQLSAFAAVAGDVGDGEALAGVPAGPARQQLRIIKASERLPELLKRVRELEARLSALESSEDH